MNPVEEPGNVGVNLAILLQIMGTVKRLNIMSDKVIKEGAAVLVTQAKYAELSNLTLQHVKFLCSPTCEKWRCAKRIDERDLKRFSKTKVMIWYQPSNMVSGKDRPRLLEREDPVRLDSDSLMRTNSAGRGAVLDTIEKAAQEGRLYMEDDEGEAD